MDGKIKISLSLVTFNEQRNMLPLLNNVYDMFDEIVIADGCSTDKTLKVIDDFKKANNDSKIKVYIMPQVGARYSRTWNQSAQRNLALTNCTKDWVFTMDADERLDADTRERLEQLVASAPEQIAFAMPTFDYWDTEDQIRINEFWYPNYHYRFWRNNLLIRYSPHQRHCYPLVPKYPDVRKTREEKSELPYTNVVIHHYHHCPIQRSGSMYRCNYRDVKTINELVAGLKVKKVTPRTKSHREVGI